VELSRSLAADSTNYPDLIDALSTSNHPACCARFLQLAAEPFAQRAADAFRRGFVRAAQSEPAFAHGLRELLRRFGERERAIFVASLHDMESEAAILALLGLPDLRPVADTLVHMVRSVALGRAPAKGHGVHHLVPRAANEVRRKLAELLRSESSETRAIAAMVLAAIQKHRLQHGQPLDEPLHPDATLIPALRGPWSLVV